MYSQIVFGHDTHIINFITKISQKSDEKEILESYREGNNDRPPKWLRCEKNVDNPNKYRAVFSPIIPTCV